MKERVTVCIASGSLEAASCEKHTSRCELIPQIFDKFLVPTRARCLIVLWEALRFIRYSLLCRLIVFIRALSVMFLMVIMVF
jgi:hypothetical protein